MSNLICQGVITQMATGLMLSRKLPEESNIASIQISDVDDPESPHAQSLHTKSECESTPLFGINPEGLKDVRVHHSSSAEFDPIVIPPVIDFDAWFGEWEERRAKANLHVASQIARCKQSQYALELSHCDMLVDPEPFHLMEHGEVSRVGSVRAIDTTERYDSQRQWLRLHDSNLDRTGLASQQHRISIRWIAHLLGSRGKIEII